MNLGTFCIYAAPVVCCSSWRSCGWTRATRTVGLELHVRARVPAGPTGVGKEQTMSSNMPEMPPVPVGAPEGPKRKRRLWIPLTVAVVLFAGYAGQDNGAARAVAPTTEAPAPTVSPDPSLTPPTSGTYDQQPMRTSPRR